MGTYLNTSRCLHFTNNWEEGDDVEGDGVYLDKKYVLPAAAKQCVNLCVIEGTYNESWKVHILFGEHVTYNGSRAVGW